MTIVVEPQPSELPRTSAKTIANSPPEKVISPAQSTPVASGSFDSWTRRSVTARAMIPTGTLTKKIHCQPAPSVSAPPTSGPTATAAPIVAP